MAEYMEKLMAKTLVRLKIGQSDKPKPPKDKPVEGDLADDIPPEDPSAYQVPAADVGSRSTRR